MSIAPRISFRMYKRVSDIPDELFWKLHDTLTHGAWGMMQTTMKYIRKSDYECPAVVAIVEGTPVSWCLLDLTNRAQMYTAAKYRGRGLATRVLARLMRMTNASIGVYPDKGASETKQRADEFCLRYFSRIA